MSDIETQIGGLLSIAEQQLKVAAAQQQITASTLADLRTQMGALAALGPSLTAGVKEGVTNGAREAVKETAGDYKSTMVQLRTTIAAVEADLNGSAARFRRDWAATLFAAIGAFVALLILAGIGFEWWSRLDVQGLQDRKDALQADLSALEARRSDFEGRGRRLLWSACDGAPCVAVRVTDRIWSTPDGTRYAIPLNAPKP